MIASNPTFRTPLQSHEQGLVRRQLPDVGPQAALTAVAERELFHNIIDDACPVSRARVIAASLHLVAAVTAKYSGRGIPLDTLIERGESGLNSAIDTFDPTHGGRFSTYATWGIKQALKQTIHQRTPMQRIGQA